MKRERPLLVYDGDCRFCTLWIARFRARTGDRVEYRPSQEAAREFPEVPAAAFEKSVQFMDVDGRRCERAEAVFRCLATASWAGRILLWMFAGVPPFARLCDAFYGLVARQRTFFSLLTRLLWGRDVRPPAYAVSTTIFLRLLGLIFFIAFVSFGVQAKGLLGAHGILPVREVFPQAAEALGSDAWWRWPTLVWLWPDDGMLFVLTWAGCVCSILIVLGMLQPLALAGAWACYLSLVVAGQDFYSFQWDMLLLEAGLLAVFAAPWSWRPNAAPRAPNGIARFLLVWLLFRLMFSSGVVKLSSGDVSWQDFTALDYHYWTQPIPNAVAWVLAQAPEWFQKFSCVGMFGVELVLPFFVFLPRRLRLAACAGFVGLQFLIALSGNYGFFNLLAGALALLLVDDAVWPRLRNAAFERVTWPRWILPVLAPAYFAVSLVPLAGAFRSMPAAIEPMAWLYDLVAPFRSINGYGLFAVMTKERTEILIQGSMDGMTWKNYQFKYKPGALNRMPPFVAPYMPRLDWQMWFAALGDVHQSPWMGPFALRLFRAEPDVLALLARDPFNGKPPRFLRANLDGYRFTDFSQRRASGNWWRSEPRGIYFPEISREQLAP